MENNMKTKSAVWAGLIFLFSCLSSGWAQDAAGLEGVLSLTAEDYQEVSIAGDQEESRNLFKSIFASLDDIHMATTVPSGLSCIDPAGWEIIPAKDRVAF
jgi:hypothetical protein